MTSPRSNRYYPPKPILNTSGKFSVVITISKKEWEALDKHAAKGDISRAELARRILKEALNRDHNAT